MSPFPVTVNVERFRSADPHVRDMSSALRIPVWKSMLIIRRESLFPYSYSIILQALSLRSPLSISFRNSVSDSAPACQALTLKYFSSDFCL